MWEEQQVEYLLAVEDDPLAREMLIKIKNEGIPEDIAFAFVGTVASAFPSEDIAFGDSEIRCS